MRNSATLITLLLMYKILLMFLFCFYALVMQAQNDTFYISSDGKMVTRDMARFKRVVKKLNTLDKFLIQDYFLTGQLQMTGYSADSNGEKLTDSSTRYRKDGSLESVSEYIEDLEKIKFYSLSGRYISEATFKSGLPIDGEYPPLNLADFIPGYLQKYVGGRHVESIIYYDNGKPASRRIVMPNNTKGMMMSMLIQYNYNGSELNRVEVEGLGLSTKYYNGKVYEFHRGKLDPKIEYRTGKRIIKSITEYRKGLILYKRNFDMKGKEIEVSFFLDNRMHSGLFVGNDGSTVHYKNGGMAGERYFYNFKNNVIATAHYENGKIKSGALISDYVKSEYKNFKENGIRVTFLSGNRNFIDTVSITNIIDGKKEGLEIRYMNNKPKLFGNYKDDKPWSGSFLIRGVKIYDYKEGIQVGEQLIGNLEDREVIINKIDYVKRTILSTNPWNNEKYEATCDEKNKPMDGKCLIGEGVNHYMLCNYEKGKLEGVRTLFDIDGSIIEIATFIDGQRNGYYQNFYTGKKGTYINNICKECEKVEVRENYNNYKYSKNGRIKETLYNSSGSYFYVNGVKQNTAIYYLESKPGVLDSTKFYGIFKDNNPIEGWIFSVREISLDYTSGFGCLVLNEYRNGKKNGIERVYYSHPEFNNYEDFFYKNDTLLSKSVLNLCDTTFTNVYEGGQIKNGFKLTRGGNNFLKFSFIENFEANFRNQFTVSSSLLRMNDEIVSGKVNKENGETWHYKNLKLAKIEQFNEENFEDLFKTTKFNEEGFISRFANGDLFAIGKNINADHVKINFYTNNIISDSAFFINSYSEFGCFKTVLPNWISEKYTFDSIKICAYSKDSMTFQLFDLKNNIIREFGVSGWYRFNEINEILSSDMSYADQTIYDLRTKSVLAKYKNNSGITLDFRYGHYGIIRKYLDSKIVKELVVNRKNLRKSIKSISQ